MVISNSPIIFWYVLLDIIAMIKNTCDKRSYLLDGQVPHSMMTVNICDISMI